MPAAVEMDCLIALSRTPTSTLTPASEEEGCTVVITNLDPSWPGTTLKARRVSSEGKWQVQGGTGKRGDWVAYLGSALDVSLAAPQPVARCTSETPTF